MSWRRRESSSGLGLIVNGDVWALLALLFMSLFTSMVPLVTVNTTTDSEDIEADLAAANESAQTAIELAEAAEQDRQFAVAEAKNWENAAHQANLLAATQQQRAADAEIQARREGQRADAAESRAASESSRAKRAENELATKSVDIVFLIDASQSQAARIALLVERVRMLLETLGPLTTLRVGVIAYRMEHQVFHLTEIQPVNADRGESLAKLDRFLKGIDTESSATDLAAAINRGLSMLEASSNPLAAKRLATLTDVGPFEAGDTSPAAARALQDRLVSWITSNDQNGTVHIFTGNQNRDRDFFRGIAQRAGNRATFSENPSDMLEPLLRGITSR